VHLCKRPRGPPAPVALLLARTVPLAILTVPLSPLAPIPAVPGRPRALRTPLVVAIVGVAPPLLPLPASSPLALALRLPAVALSRRLRTRPKAPPATLAPPPARHDRRAPLRPTTGASLEHAVTLRAFSAPWWGVRSDKPRSHFSQGGPYARFSVRSPQSSIHHPQLRWLKSREQKWLNFRER